MKKRVLALLVGACMMASLAGCGSKEISNDKITIKQYEGLEVEKVTPIEVTEETIDASIQSTLEAYSTRIEITDRPVQDGDVVTIDYLGKVDGVAFEGGTAEGAELEIGSNTFIDGFEEKIIGHSLNETFDIDVTFPEGYNEELGGKAAVFTITLHKIEEKQLPELTDEFVQEISDTATTVEEYREQERASQTLNNEQTAQQSLEQLVWQALIENCVIDKYPEDKLEEVKANVTSQYTNVAAMYGVTEEELVEQVYGVTVEEMAKNLIKQEYAVELIAEKEGLTLTLEGYEKGLAEFAEQYGYDDPAEFEEMIGEEELKKAILQKNVGQWLIDNCVQVEE